jgi:hypothetical protein
MNNMKNLLIAIFIVLGINTTTTSLAQGSKMSISNVNVTIGDKTGQGADFNFPFKYGSWSPKQTIYNNDGTVITASFKLVSQKTGRSEMKNSSVKLYVDYNVEHAGDKRSKSTEHIYYLDTERAFESSETFSFKPTRYDVRVVKLKFKGTLGE